jgi:hypothetical protein
MSDFDPKLPPHIFMPPMDIAHDIYSLTLQTKGFDHLTYQDIQQDKSVYDSFQRWPYLFNITLASTTEEPKTEET